MVYNWNADKSIRQICVKSIDFRRNGRYISCVAPKQRGAVAQLGERLNGIQEVRGSIPLASMPRGAGSPQHPPEASWFRFHAGIAQLVEHNLAKVGVAGSSPVSRSIFKKL